MLKLGANRDILHACFILQDSSHFLGTFLDVEYRDTLLELALIIVQQCIVQNIVDEIVNSKAA
jgi:hypothetical protein